MAVTMLLSPEYIRVILDLSRCDDDLRDFTGSSTSKRCDSVWSWMVRTSIPRPRTFHSSVPLVASQCDVNFYSLHFSIFRNEFIEWKRTCSAIYQRPVQPHGTLRPFSIYTAAANFLRPLVDLQVSSPVSSPVFFPPHRPIIRRKYGASRYFN